MIVVAGEALVDLLIFADGSVEAALGGGPFNVARTVARLGHRCRFLGRLSIDRFGQRLVTALSNDGVELGITARCGDPTTLAAAELDAGGSASYRFYLEGTSAPGLRPEHLVGPGDSSTIDAVHIGSLGLVLEPMASTLLEWVGTVGRGSLVMVDLNCRPNAVADHDRYRTMLTRFVSAADVVKASTEDIGFMFPGVAVDAAVAALLHLGAEVVLLTDGASPVTVTGPSGTRTVAVESVQVVDTVGAGDTFGAGFLAWWIEHGLGRGELGDLDLLTRATAIGASVSAITCTRAGADPPRRDEISGW